MVKNPFGIVPVMDFQVLGSLRVLDGDTACRLGGPKARSLLAMLVAAAGSPVGMDSLLLGMYGPDADPSQRRSVQTYVSSFRRVLGDVIERRPEGYRLDVPGDDIDAVRFESSLELARSLIDESAAAGMLQDALGLWRGPAYADVEAHAVLAAEVRRLEELRLGAIEARIELDLAAGRHHDLVPEIESIVARHPTRERLRSSLMLALYRSGRQADALRLFRSTEEYLREELGLVPSPDLRRLEVQILQQDETLDYRPKPRPRPVPARYTSFVGRATELAEVSELVRKHRLVTLTGPGGIGKTSLAAEVTRSLSTTMSASFVAVETHRAADLLSLIAASLGLQPAEDADLLELVATTIGDTPTLLVLDGCEHVIETMPGIVGRILRRSADVRLLITSREALFVTGEHRYSLGPLEQGSGSAADRVFADRANLRLAELDADSARLVTVISAGLSGIPLALELAAARTRTLSLADIAGRLDSQVDLLTASRSADERHSSLLRALDWSYRLLSERQQATFRRLGVFRSGVHVRGAAHVLDLDDAIPRLEELADVSLLARTADGYVVLEPIRQFAWRLMEDGGELAGVERRYAEWIVAWSEELRDRIIIDRDPGAYQALRAAAPEIEATAIGSLDRGTPEIVLHVVAALARPWIQVLDGRRLREAAHRALRVADAPMTITLVATAHTALMFREHDREISVALLRRAEEMLPSVSDAAARFFTLSAMASIHHALELLPREREIQWLDAAIEFADEAGYPPDREHRNRVLSLVDVGREDEASSLVDALVARADPSIPIDRGGALLLRAVMHRLDAELEAGLSDAREAARLLADAGNFDQAAQAEFERAKMLILLGQSERASLPLEAIDKLHGLIGLPAAAEYDPALAARIAGDLRRWPEFEELMAIWIADLGDDERLREQRLRGDTLAYSHVVVLLSPCIRWSAAHGHDEDAARLAAAAEMALAETSFTPWERLGEAQRLRATVREVAGDHTPDAVPGDLMELFAAMTARVGTRE